jgi:chorismate mutase
MERIRELRREIDKIDLELIKLLDKRISLAVKIGSIKKSLGISVIDVNREDEVLKRAGKYREVFRLIINICREVQRR